ncbi:NAD(P)-binding protein [Biscogniauxia marginata]|nr:NAD(P)-binding protein [Biscogniauxia marginata]
MTANTTSLSPVIITGGCGFIGFHLANDLLERDPKCDIHVIDIDTSRNRIPGVTYHICDISSLVDVEAVFAKAKPKTIFHVALNVVGARNLLISAEKIATVQAFINTSTSSVIHDNLTDLFNADETFPVLQYPAQKRVYTLTKAEAETGILAANRKNGDSSMLTVSIRPASTFGERDGVCMGKIVANARAGKAKFQMGPGNNIYIRLYALIRAYGNPPPPLDMRVDGQSFNVINNEPVKFWEFQRAIAASVGLPVKMEEIKIIPIWVALLMANINEWIAWIRTWGKGQPLITREIIHLTTVTRTPNGEKARRVLGYEPRFTMDEGLARAGKWFMEEEKRMQEAKKTV